MKRTLVKARPNNTRQACGVYFREEAVHVITVSETEAGIGVNDRPIFRLPPSPKAHELGVAILKASAASREGLPDKGWKEKEKEFVAIHGCTWRTFARGARYLLIMRCGRKVEVVPSEYDRGGFYFLPRHQAFCGVNPEEIGRTVLMQLKFCS